MRSINSQLGPAGLAGTPIERRIERMRARLSPGVGDATSDYCISYMQNALGTWVEQEQGDCATVTANAKFLANQPNVVLAVYSWNAQAGSWTGPVIYSQNTAGAEQPFCWVKIAPEVDGKYRAQPGQKYAVLAAVDTRGSVSDFTANATSQGFKVLYTWETGQPSRATYYVDNWLQTLPPAASGTRWVYAELHYDGQSPIEIATHYEKCVAFFCGAADIAQVFQAQPVAASTQCAPFGPPPIVGGRKTPVGGIALIGGALAGVGYLGWRWWRHRHGAPFWGVR